MKKDFSNLGFSYLSIEEKRIVSNLFYVKQSERRQCLHPGCGRVAIGSHLLQKNGVLNKISEEISCEQQIMQLEVPTPYFHMRFRKKSIASAEMFVFSGFCDMHDAPVFEEIEKPTCDFTSYRQQLLSAYRGQLNELAKQYFLVDFHAAILEDHRIAKSVKQYYEEIRRMMACRIRHGEYYKQLIEKEIYSDAAPNFTFHRFDLPKIEIATSAVSGLAVMIPTLSYEDIRAARFELFSMSSYASIIFINLIPTDNSLIFSFGHSNNANQFSGVDINELNSFTVQRMFKFISDLLVKIIETWCISPSLYNTLKLQGKIDELLAIKSSMDDSRKLSDIEFNMFDRLV